MDTSDKINYLIDQATPVEGQDRKYLGASIIGHQCERHVQYHLLAARGKVQRTDPEPRVLRIFDRGNTYEEKARQWLKQAGFRFGRKFNNKFVDFDGQFAGHVDGVITGWKPSSPCPITLPVLWENKCLGSKNWKKVADVKLKEYSSTYYIQTQIYMCYLQLDNCLFTAVNADSMELYHELVPYVALEAAFARDRVAAVIGASDNGTMVARMTKDPSFYICRWCNFSEDCWRAE